MTKSAWTVQEVPDQNGRVVVVTGANSGLGLEVAQVLAHRGATVVLACRNLEKAAAAKEAILRGDSRSKVEIRELDLSKLQKIQDFVANLSQDHEAVSLLINNAGVMALPRRETADGFEMHLGTNHLGHFALTGRMMPLLMKAAETDPHVRVVTVSSAAHKVGRIHFHDLNLTQRYGEWKAYGQSKLANLLFAFELDRRLTKAAAPIVSVAAHPGYSATNLQFVGPKMRGSRFTEAIMRLGNRVVAQSAREGAWPILRAACDPEAAGGQYYGPGGPGELWGPPVVVRPNDAAMSPGDAERLWRASREMTGVTYPVLGLT